MAGVDQYKGICVKDFDPAKVAALAVKDPAFLSRILEGLDESRATIKYGCDKVLRYLSAKSPEILYPHFDAFAANLTSDKTLLKWGAIHIVANLTTVDSEDKFRGIFDAYFAPIRGPVLITAANIVKGAAVIARAKPEYVDAITKELMKVEKARYQTAECSEIALGQVIKAFDQFFDCVSDKKPIVNLIKRRLKSRRPATRKAAEKFIAKHRA